MFSRYIIIHLRRYNIILSFIRVVDEPDVKYYNIIVVKSSSCDGVFQILVGIAMFP